MGTGPYASSKEQKMSLYVEYAQRTSLLERLLMLSRPKMRILSHNDNMFAIYQDDTLTQQIMDIMEDTTMPYSEVETRLFRLADQEKFIACCLNTQTGWTTLYTQPCDGIVYFPNTSEQCRVLTTSKDVAYDYDTKGKLLIACIAPTWKPHSGDGAWLQKMYTLIHDRAGMRGKGLAEYLMKECQQEWVVVIACRNGRKPMTTRLHPR